MSTNYFYKLVDSWTPALQNFPRWFKANEYGGLTDWTDVPDLTAFGTSLSFPSVTTDVPVGWYSTTTLPATSGKIMQGLFESVAYEKQLLSNLLTRYKKVRSLFYDTSDLNYAWLCQINDEAELVELKLSDGSFVTLPRSQYDSEITELPHKVWSQFGTQVVVFGLDVVDTITETRVDEWQFIKHSEWWTPESKVWLQHPRSEAWLPIHQSLIREDGFLAFVYPGTINLKVRLAKAGSGLDIVTLRIDSVEIEATRIDINNSLDDKGVWFDLYRQPGETNQSYSDALLLNSWFTDQTNRGVTNSLSARLRKGSLSVVSPTASGFTLPAGATNYTVRNIEGFNYVLERNMVYDQNKFVSIFNNPELGYTYHDNRYLPTTISGHVVTPKSPIGTIDLNTEWKVTYWNKVGSNVTFTSNLPQNIPDLVIYFSEDVLVSNAGAQALKKAFDRTSPSLRWHSFEIEAETIQGMAEFI